MRVTTRTRLAVPALRALGCTLALTVMGLAACSADGSDDGSGRPGGRAGVVGVGGVAGAAGTSAAAAGSGAADPFGNTTPGAMGAAGTSGDPLAGMVPDETCAEGLATATPVTPIVWLIVDGSSSMNQAFEGASTRWQTLRTTLMSPTGVVASLQSVAKFGLVIYSGGNADPAQCVKLVTVDPALDNFAAIDAAYPLDPIGMGTPTDKALDYVVTNLPVVTSTDVLDTQVDPVYVVLATDGQPNDNCGTGGGGGGAGDAAVQQRVVDVVTRGTTAGMQMFVISLAGGDGNLQSHLDQVALATASKTPPFVPATQADLITTFQAIVGGASCQIALDGEVKEGKECTGEVSLSGTPLACGSDNGFQLVNPRTVQLTGTACTSFLSMQSLVYASFPCEAFSPD